MNWRRWVFVSSIAAAAALGTLATRQAQSASLVGTHAVLPSKNSETAGTDNGRASAASLTAFQYAQSENQKAQAEKSRADAAVERLQAAEKHQSNIVGGWVSVISSIILTVLFPFVFLLIILLSLNSIIAAFRKGGWSITLPGGLSVSVQQLTAAVANVLAQPPPASPMPIDEAVAGKLQLTDAYILNQPEDLRARLTATAAQSDSTQNEYFSSAASTILSTQLQAIETAARSPLSQKAAKALFQRSSKTIPLSYESWIDYLLRFGFLEAAHSTFDITDVGKEFLKWTTDNRITASSLAKAGR